MQTRFYKWECSSTSKLNLNIVLEEMFPSWGQVPPPSGSNLQCKLEPFVPCSSSGLANMLSQFPESRVYPPHRSVGIIPSTVSIPSTYPPPPPHATIHPLLLSKTCIDQAADSPGLTTLTGSKWEWQRSAGGSRLVQRSDRRGRKRPTQPGSSPGPPAASSQLGADKQTEREVLAFHWV